MKVSTKGRYGLRIMLELALCHDKNLLTAREIALQQGISEKYVEQIIGLLTKAKLVRSQRGANGGYRLAETPSMLTVGKILRVTEGGLGILDTSLNDSPQNQSVTTAVWSRVEEAIEEVVDNITLADMVAQHNQNFNFSYMI